MRVSQSTSIKRNSPFLCRVQCHITRSSSHDPYSHTPSKWVSQHFSINIFGHARIVRSPWWRELLPSFSSLGALLPSYYVSLTYPVSVFFSKCNRPISSFMSALQQARVQLRNNYATIFCFNFYFLFSKFNIYRPGCCFYTSVIFPLFPNFGWNF